MSAPGPSVRIMQDACKFAFPMNTPVISHHGVAVQAAACGCTIACTYSLERFVRVRKPGMTPRVVWSNAIARPWVSPGASSPVLCPLQLGLRSSTHLVA